MTDRVFADEEEFCDRCGAGAYSSEHLSKCVRPGHAEYGYSVEQARTDAGRGD